MNEALKQFSTKLAEELKAKFASEQVGEFIKAAKASGDDRTFEVVMSTSDEDRQGDSLDQSKWDLKYFNLNPVVLFAHNYSSFPIGVIEDIRIEGNSAVATGKFAPAGVNADADLACALYQEKILRAVSPGYIQNDDGTRELLEVSFCPVPAGRFALSMRQVGRLGVSTSELVTKGFFFNESKSKANEDDKPGDPCELEDGSPGVLAEQDGGKLVCVPKPEKSKSNENMNELEKKLKAEHARHGKCVGKEIDEFAEKCEKCEKAEHEKAIDEFKDALDGEHEVHLEKCMKAIDDSYESFGRKPNDEKAVKAIEEFKGEHDEADGDDEREEAHEKMHKAMSDELERHEKAHMEMCKAEADKFGEDDEEGKSESEKALADAIQKAGRSISAKNKEKLKAILEKMESHHNDVTAALKELIGSEDGDGGEEPKKPEGEKPEGDKALNSRSSTLGGSADLETYLFTQRLVRQVKTATEGASRQINEKIKELTSRGR